MAMSAREAGSQDEVRDVIARGVHRAVPLGAWGDDPEYTMDCYYQADAILAEVAVAGYVVVPRDWYERLRLFGGRMFADEFSDCDEWRNWQNAGLQPGDLARSIRGSGHDGAGRREA